MIPESFHFLRPLWLAALIPAALVLWAAGRSAVRTSPWRHVVDAHLLRHLLAAEDRPLRRWPLLALAIGWIAAAVAMAGPTWERIPEPAWTSRQPTVAVLDLSPAMNAEDLSPSRLARARHKLHDVIDATRGGQIALVLYTEEPFVAAPLTDDGRVIEEMIPSLEPGLMPGSGSRPARALAEASALLERAGAPAGNVVLLTATPGDDPAELERAAAALAAAGRKLSVVGLGTAEGAPLRDARGRIARDAGGQPVVTRLDASALASVASTGGGRFAVATADDADVRSLLESPAPIDAAERATSGVQADTWRDAGVWLLAIPLLLAPLAFRRGALASLALAVLLAPASSARASAWSDLWATPDQQAQAALDAGRPGDAAALFEDPAWKAAAQYESGAFDAAAEAYAALGGTESRYNLGNALARSGQLEQAIAAYDEAIAAQPEHADAAFNRELVAKLLEQQRREEEQRQKEKEEQQGSSDSPQGGQEEPQEGGEAQDGGNDHAQGQPRAGGDEPQALREQAQGEPQQADASQGDEAEGDEADPSESRAGSPGTTQQPDAAARDDATASPEPAQGEDDARAAAAAEEPGKNDETSAAAPRPTPGADDGAYGREVDRALAEPASAGDAKPDLARAPRPRTSEEEQAREQKLRGVPDDPGGLLRARIRRHFAGDGLAQR